MNTPTFLDDMDREEMEDFAETIGNEYGETSSLHGDDAEEEFARIIGF